MAIDNETTRLMTSWAMWRTGGSTHGMAVSTAFSEARDSYDTPMPLINGEALEVDQAVHAMRPELQRVVIQFWCKRGTVAERAARAGCGMRTFYDRLDQAHAAVHAHRAELRRRLGAFRKSVFRSHG